MADVKQARCDACGRRDVPVYEDDGAAYLDDHYASPTSIESWCNGSHRLALGRIVTAWQEEAANV